MLLIVIASLSYVFWMPLYLYITVSETVLTLEYNLFEPTACYIPVADALTTGQQETL